MVKFKDHEYSMSKRMGVRGVCVCLRAGGDIIKSDWGVNMLCRANMGSENDMFNIHGQV